MSGIHSKQHNKKERFSRCVLFNNYHWSPEGKHFKVWVFWPCHICPLKWGYSARALRWSLRLSLRHDCRPESLSVGLWISESATCDDVWPVNKNWLSLTPGELRLAVIFFVQFVQTLAAERVRLWRKQFFLGSCNESWNQTWFWNEHGMNSSSCVKRKHLKTCIFVGFSTVISFRWSTSKGGSELFGVGSWQYYLHDVLAFRTWDLVVKRCVGWRWNARCLTKLFCDL